MGRIRTIKPEFFMHEELSALDAQTHLFAAGLLCYADDEGYFNANEGLLKAAIFPLRESSVSIHDMLTQLVDVGYIRLGNNCTARQYGQVIHFAIHQRVNRPTQSKISNLQLIWGNSLKTHPQLTEDSPLEGKGREGNWEEEGKQLPPPLRVISDSGSELMAANWLLEELCVPADNGCRKSAAESIRMLAKEGGTVDDAMRYIFEAGKRAIADGETITRFWFSDQKYKPQVPVKTKRQKAKDAVWKEFEERTKSDDEE